jgi:hypothetical protein
MYGYPIGLWDSYNNFPIIRKGVTASSPSCDFNGQPEGVIDMACFPGSSGSPVFVINEGGTNFKGGGFTVMNRYVLLGVYTYGFQFNEEGNIILIDVPVRPTKKMLGIHLGRYIKVTELLSLFKEVLRKTKIQ